MLGYPSTGMNARNAHEKTNASPVDGTSYLCNKKNRPCRHYLHGRQKLKC